MHRPHPIRGFTLIELMIAVSLGMLIVYVAVAGFRVASQTLTKTHQLALENDMLRASCMLANERLDFWTDYDDPQDATKQKLRAANGGGGAPFAPMSVVFPLVKDLSNPELTRGWDPNESWKVSDPRTWWHGNLAEKFNTDMRLGRYGIFGNSKPPVFVTGDTVGVNAIGVYGTVSVPHEWHYRQVWGMHNALGYYGFVDYMPQNTIFACYQEYKQPGPVWADDATNQDGMPLVLFKPGSSFDNGEGYQEYPKGLWRLTMVSSYGVVSPTSANANDPSAHRNRYTTGYWNNEGDFKRFLRETENQQQLMDGPIHWPTIDVTVQHFVKTGRFVNFCRVQLHSPITGVTTELAFTGFSTTLRGARLQRRHPTQGSGWADYDNKVGVTNPLTLDDTP